MSALKGDYLGFTFDGIHSTDLGITRVSDGSRYTDNLLPTISDKTVQIPGNDGTYYFGSYYTNKQFSFPIAFDSITDAQLRKIRQIFGDKKIHTLIFDEHPYKEYKVKVTGTPNLKYVAFDEEEDYNDLYNEADLYGGVTEDFYEGSLLKSKMGRIYKGEGTLSFTAYSPFARSRHINGTALKYLDQYNFDTIPEWGKYSEYTNGGMENYNLEAWKDTVLLHRSYDTCVLNNVTYQIDTPTSDKIAIYNPGDVDTDCIIKFNINANNTDNDFIGLNIKYNDAHLKIDAFKLKDGDYGIQINNFLHLIEGIDQNGNLTGTLYNEYILSGDFFSINPSMNYQFINLLWEDTSLAVASNNISIIYDYLFF